MNAAGLAILKESKTGEKPMDEKRTRKMVDLNRLAVQPAGWELRGLSPLPEEEWERLKRFLELGGTDYAAMLATVEPLFQHGIEMVAANYAYLAQNPETAAILGWESGADPAHLAERRRFFTVWLARTLGLDQSVELARYLFRAGQIHAGHGPRHMHVPPVFITGAVSRVQASFAATLAQEMPGFGQAGAALAGWNKLLTLHLHMMLQGYASAQACERGDLTLPVTLYGRMRALLGREEFKLHMNAGENVLDALRKFFDYFPQARAEALEAGWLPGERVDEMGKPWMTVETVYRPKFGWRVLLNGRQIDYLPREEWLLKEGDELQVFPPGR